MTTDYNAMTRGELEVRRQRLVDIVGYRGRMVRVAENDLHEIVELIAKNGFSEKLGREKILAEHRVKDVSYRLPTFQRELRETEAAMRVFAS